MKIVAFILSFFVVEMVCAFGLAQLLISLRVAIPLSIMFGRKYPGRYPQDQIILRALLTVLFWVVFLGGAAIGIDIWGNQSVIYGAACGAVVALFLDWRATGINASTIEDFFKAYGALIGDELQAEIRRDYAGGQNT